MKKKIYLVLLPILVGLFITVIVLVIPAKASQQQPLIDWHDRENQVFGKIESFPDQLLGDWIVNGITYTADSHTEFSEEHGPFSVGVCVDVEYIRNEHGEGYRATRIQSEYAFKCDHSQNPLSETRGVVVSFPENLVGTWVVDTATYTATINTRFEQEHGSFFVGGCVDVKYVTKTHEAVEIETNDTEACGGEGEEHFYGLINQVPETLSITSTWVISGIDFISTPDTQLRTEHGPLAVGACAKVEYQVVSGQNIANGIESEWPFYCIGWEAFNQVYGSVVSFPPDLYGTWVISATGDASFMFLADPYTRFEGEYRDITIGTCIQVEYYTQDGVNHAVEVSVKHGDRCGRIEAPSLSKLFVTIETRPTDTLTGTWTFAGVPFTATTATHFEMDGAGLQVGDCIEAKYDPAGGAMLLNHVDEKNAYKCQAHDGSELFKLFGVVEMMPGGGVLTGTWEVSGVPLEAISTTMFEQDHGVLAVGAYVEVRFTYDAGTGVRTATEIETHVAPGCGRIHHFGHLERIQLGTGPDEYDIWTVDGVSYLGDPAMEASPNLKVGSLVAVNAYEGNGNLYATSVTSASSIYLPLLSR